VAVATAGHMQVCTSLQTDNHASTSPLSFLQAGCPSYCPTNSIKALKAILNKNNKQITAGGTLLDLGRANVFQDKKLSTSQPTRNYFAVY